MHFSVELSLIKIYLSKLFLLVNTNLICHSFIHIPMLFTTLGITCGYILLLFTTLGITWEYIPLLFTTLGITWEYIPFLVTTLGIACGGFHNIFPMLGLKNKPNIFPM